MTKRILFLICASNSDGENADLFIWANSEAEALDFWRSYFDCEGDGETAPGIPDRLIVAPTDPGTCGGSVDWESVTQVVYDRAARKSACLTPEHDKQARAVIDNATKEA